MEEAREERQKRLLAKSKERLEFIVGKATTESYNEGTMFQNKPILRNIQNFKSDELESNDSGTESPSGESSEMLPAVPQPIKKTIKEKDFFRELLTWIHTLMLIVLGIFSHAAFHQSCDSSCLSVIHRNITPMECRDHLFLGRVFFYGGLFSVEIPFLFLTIKSCKTIGWTVVIRIVSGICLYIVSHIASGILYETFNK